jgi:hypothetical protein
VCGSWYSAGSSYSPSRMELIWGHWNASDPEAQ